MSSPSPSARPVSTRGTFGVPSGPVISAATAVSVAVSLILAGCTVGRGAVEEAATSSVPEAASKGPTTRAGFPTGVAFDYQLGGAYAPPEGVGIVVRDRLDPPAAGIYSVCYVNAFQTQPGERGRWPDEVLLKRDGRAVTDPDWLDEVLLDTSTARSRAAILETLTPWIDRCARDGYDAVEFDNLDSHTRSRGRLSLEDNVALAGSLAEAAHGEGLAVGQKNAAEAAQELRERAGFDFAVAEECAAYEECGSYREAYGDAVLDIEYTDHLPRPFVELCEADVPGATILRDRELVTPGERGYVRKACP